MSIPMGMFDSLICKYPLPDGFIGPETEGEGEDTYGYWQTWSLERCLLIYTLGEDGRLTYEEWDYEPCWHEPKHFTVLLNKPAMCRVDKSKRIVDSNFHGLLTFHAGYREYTAKFTDGKLVEIKGGLEE